MYYRLAHGHQEDRGVPLGHRRVHLRVIRDDAHHKEGPGNLQLPVLHGRPKLRQDVNQGSLLTALGSQVRQDRGQLQSLVCGSSRTHLSLSPYG